jgi:hypothetical protein
MLLQSIHAPARQCTVIDQLRPLDAVDLGANGSELLERQGPQMYHAPFTLICCPVM